MEKIWIRDKHPESTTLIGRMIIGYAGAEDTEPPAAPGDPAPFICWLIDRQAD
jgi:hypothetical protein